jgi:transcriptional regulator with XRE-family HTH domain
MRERKLSDRTLAELAQISFTTVQNLRRGFGGQAGIGTVFNIAHALGVSPAWLAFGEKVDP